MTRMVLGMAWASAVCYVALSHANPIATLSQTAFRVLTFYAR